MAPPVCGCSSCHDSQFPTPEHRTQGLTLAAQGLTLAAHEPSGAVAQGDVVFLLKTQQKDATFDLGAPEIARPVDLTDATVFSAVRDFDHGPFDGFVPNYDPTKAKKVHRQSDSIVVVEAEDYDAADRDDVRKWNLTTVDNTPDVQPDPDPNHAEGAVTFTYAHCSAVYCAPSRTSLMTGRQDRVRSMGEIDTFVAGRLRATTAGLSRTFSATSPPNPGDAQST